MSNALYRLGRTAARRPLVTIGAWLAIALLVIAAAAAAGHDLKDSYDVPGLDSQQAGALLSAAGAERGGLTAQLVVPAGAAEGVRTGAAALPHVLRADTRVAPNAGVALVRLQYPPLDQITRADLDTLKAFVAGTGLDIEMGGDLFFAFEDAGAGLGELVGLLAAAVILLLAFGSVVAMGLPIGLALFGLALGVSALPLVAHLIDMPTFAPQLAAMIGIGVGIDYALLLITRHREYLANGVGVEESAARAVASAGRAIIFAGGTVVIAILGLAVAGIPFLTAIGVAIAVVVAILVVAAVTLLPAFLALAGQRIGGGRAHSTQAWTRWAGHVTRHAVPYTIGGTLVLLVLAAPALALRLDAPDDGNLPQTRTERRAYDRLAAAFGPGVNGPLVIAVDPAGDKGVVGRLRAALAADPGIAAVGPAETFGRATALVAQPTTAPQDDATSATVERLRAKVIPAALHGSPARAHVGGQTATWGDIGARLNARLASFLLAVVALSFVLLAFVFRSLVVPLKAALLNLLSIGAAYGVVVMVFQWGWGGGLIGLESTLPVEPFIPVMMFAFLFGLSMDYEVFLLSGIREHYLRSGDNDGSVIRGVAGTGRVITSAALIMIAVFLGFVFASDPRLKMFGVGLATAIFLDATIVRMVLVPAIMKLLGRANWWLPTVRVRSVRRRASR